MPDTMTGRIVRVVFDKGFAFVRGDIDGLSRFMHVKDMLDPADFDRIKEGVTRVQFVPADFNSSDRAKGNKLRAVEVILIETPEISPIQP